MKVLVVGGDILIERMFLNRGFEITTDEQNADIAVFTGGADVSPELYGEPNFASHVNKARDDKEQRKFEYLKELGVPMVGICRGGQFLNVMNGGTMYQDVESHAIGGTHPIMDVETGDTIAVTSTHHQMMRPNLQAPDYELIAYATLGGAKSYWFQDQVVRNHDGIDFEVLYYPESKSLCFQPHPEYSHKDTESYFFKILDQKSGFEEVN